MIEIDSIVKVTYDFSRERKIYPYDYPEKGTLLTVRKIVRDFENNRMLFFDELKIEIPLMQECFEEVQDSYDGYCILNEAFKIANGL